MAIRFDVNTEAIVRTTDLLNHNAAYTRMGWIVMDVDVNHYTHFITGSAGDYSTQDAISSDTDGTSFYVEAWLNGSTFTSTSIGTLAVSTWYHVALVRESVSSLKAYINGALVGTATQNITGRTATARLSHGKESVTGDGWLNGRVSCLKYWSAALTLEQVQAEMHTISPRNATNIYGWWPLWSTTDMADYSGNARSWTTAGTLSDGDQPPVSWGSSVWMLPFAAAAPGGGVPKHMMHYKRLRA